MRRRAVIVSALVWAIGLSCSPKGVPTPRTAADVDVNRYMGVWHEIARLPFPFEIDCFGVSAKYEPLLEGEFLITNYCWKKSFFGPVQRAQAQAWVADPTDNSKFKVSFFWPFALDYWVLYVDPDYRTALVGTPDRKYLWIMSRDFTMEEATYQAMLDRAKAQGFDISEIIKTPQRAERGSPTDVGAETSESAAEAADGGVADTPDISTDDTPDKAEGVEND